MNPPPRALIVEDDGNIRDLVCLHLGLEGFECVPVSDGREALRIVAEQPLNLVVLDLMIPGFDGVTVCRVIRRGARNKDVPILMLTARREEADKVLGLESGADDYVTKPFGVRELMARVHALMRRHPAPAPPAPPAATPPVTEPPATPAPPTSPDERPVTIRGVEIDPARRRVVVRGREVTLTNQEFNLLHLLASRPGIVFSREALLSRIWKGETFVTVRSVDTLVKRLRHKIEEDQANPALIQTVLGVGYKFADV
jgi:DNA-binding response OmpR family regulator